MKKFFSVVIAIIVMSTLSGCGISKVSFPFMEKNQEYHATVSRDHIIIGAIDAEKKEDKWEVVMTSIEEDEEVNYTLDGKEYSYQEVSTSETIRMDEESFEAFIEGCKSDDSISLKEY